MFYAKQQVNKPKPALGALRHLWLSDLDLPVPAKPAVNNSWSGALPRGKAQKQCLCQRATISSQIQNLGFRYHFLCTDVDPVWLRDCMKGGSGSTSASGWSNTSSTVRNGSHGKPLWQITHLQGLGTNTLACTLLHAAIWQGFQQVLITNSQLQLTPIRRCFIKLKHQSQK